MKKITFGILLLFVTQVLFSQIPLRPNFISTDGKAEQMVQLPNNAHNIQQSFEISKAGQDVIHKYYTVTDYDIHVYGSGVVEIDSYLYFNGKYRNRPPGATKTSILKPFTMKLNQEGEKIWVRTDSLGPRGHGRTYNSNLIQLADGNLLSMGKYDDYDTTQRFFNTKTYLIKMDTAGNLIWSKIVGMPDSLGELLWSLDIIPEPDGGFTTQSYTVSESRFMDFDGTYWGDTTFVSIVRFNQYGEIVKMNRFFIGTHKTRVTCTGIIKTDDGGYLLAGHSEFENDSTYDPFYNRKSFLIKVDSMFNLIWTKVFDQSTYFLIHKTCIANSATGGYLFATSDGHPSYPIGNGYIHYGKIDNNGNMLWHNYHGKILHPNEFWVASAAPMGITDDTLGNIVVASQVNGFSGAYLFCTDSLGNEKWSRWIPYWSEILYNLRKGETGGYMLTGIGAGAWLVKTDSIGCVMPGCADTLMFIGMEETKELKDQEFIVYPNPVKSKVHFAISDQSEKITNIELYDLHGRKIVMTQPMQPTAKIDISYLPSGIYIARISTKNRILTKKILKE